jgi:hypothetical protein
LLTWRAGRRLCTCGHIAYDRTFYRDNDCAADLFPAFSVLSVM